MKQPRSPVTPEDRILTRVFETPDGKMVLKYLEAIFYNNSTFVQGNDNTNYIMYKIGQQDVVGFIHETMGLVNQPHIVGVGQPKEGGIDIVT